MKLHTLVLLITFAFDVAGQPDSTAPARWRPEKFYGGLGTVLSAPGTFLRAETGLFFENRWGLAADAMIASYKAKKTPANYKTGFCLFGNCEPKDKIQIYSLQAAYEITLPWKFMSAVVAAGPSYLIYDETQFKPASSGSFGSFFDGSNYHDFIKTRRAPGFSWHTRLLVQPFKHLAFGLGWFSNLNKVKIINGVEITLIAGKIKNNPVK